MVSRANWNGKGMFIFKRPGGLIGPNLLQNASTLPKPVREFLFGQQREVLFKEYLCMYNAQGEVVNGWLASQEDILASDWMLLDYGLEDDSEIHPDKELKVR